jgi:Rieske Fe-S protein
MPEAQCETCGNRYDKAFQVVMANETHVFDSFECAIEALAPRCTHCGCRVIGHGVEQAGEIFCCSNCAAVMGATSLQDRA